MGRAGFEPARCLRHTVGTVPLSHTMTPYYRVRSRSQSWGVLYVGWRYSPTLPLSYRPEWPGVESNHQAGLLSPRNAGLCRRFLSHLGSQP